MKYTNRLGFPEYICSWLKHDDYDHVVSENTFSATTLLKPVRVYWLSLRNNDNLQMDVSDLIASRIGTAVHDSIERIETDGVEKEIRLEKEIEIDGEVFIIRGKFDILEHQPDGSCTLRDIKTTSVWAYVFGTKDEEYRKQLSVYRWLLSDTGRDVNDVAYIDFFFTDWQSSKAKTDENYPKCKVTPGYKVELMSASETEDFIIDRVKNFHIYKDTEAKDLPPCEIKDLWASDAKWAVKKKGANRATKLCDSEEEAEAYIMNRGIKSAIIEYRAPKVKRCKYCTAWQFCSQGQDYSSRGLIQY